VHVGSCIQYVFTQPIQCREEFAKVKLTGR
jgi:hypothetical protein